MSQTPTKATEELIDAFERGEFAGQLFNVYTQYRGSGLLFSKRRAIVRAMLEAMVEAEAIYPLPAPPVDATGVKP